MKSKLFLNIYLLTSIIFAPITFLVNLLIGIIVKESSFLKLGGIFLILLISFVISAFVVIIKDQPPKLISKCKIFSYSAGFYTAISLVINIFVQIIAKSINSEPNRIWNVFSVVLTFVFSITISLLIIYFRPKSIFLLISIYFLVIGVFYYLLTITFGGLSLGNQIIITLSIYVAIYAITVLTIALIKAKKARKKRDSQPYQKQF